MRQTASLLTRPTPPPAATAAPQQRAQHMVGAAMTSTIFDDVRCPVGGPPRQLSRAAGGLVAVSDPSVAGGS